MSDPVSRRFLCHSRRSAGQTRVSTDHDRAEHSLGDESSTLELQKEVWAWGGVKDTRVKEITEQNQKRRETKMKSQGKRQLKGREKRGPSKDREVQEETQEGKQNYSQNNGNCVSLCSFYGFTWISEGGSHLEDPDG